MSEPKTKREMRVEAFRLKNARRKQYFDATNKEHRAARERRRKCGGSFGTDAFLAVGTSRAS